MKIKLVFEEGKELIILPEWVDGQVSLAEVLTSALNYITVCGRSITYDDGFIGYYWIIYDFFFNLSDLSLYFEVNPTLINIINAAMVQVKKCPELAEHQEKYQKLLKMIILIFRTAADDVVVTDNVSDISKRLYNETYALMAKSYLAEYLQCDLKDLTDEIAYAEYAKLYLEAYERNGGMFKEYAEYYLQGYSRASLEISVTGSSSVTPSSSGDDTALEESEKTPLLGEVRDRFFSSSESELRRRHLRTHEIGEGHVSSLYR